MCSVVDFSNHDPDHPNFGTFTSARCLYFRPWCVIMIKTDQPACDHAGAATALTSDHSA